MPETLRFLDEVKANVDRLTADADLHASARSWLSELTRKRYVDSFTWLGRPVIQLPQDLFVVQEIVGYLHIDGRTVPWREMVARHATELGEVR
jgi:cephalosporin hydroxylase